MKANFSSQLVQLNTCWVHEDANVSPNLNI